MKRRHAKEMEKIRLRKVSGRGEGSLFAHLRNRSTIYQVGCHGPNDVSIVVAVVSVWRRNLGERSQPQFHASKAAIFRL
jgi:hypothetical protein